MDPKEYKEQILSLGAEYAFIVLLVGVLAYLFVRYRGYRVNPLIFFIIYLFPVSALYVDAGFHLFYHRIIVIGYFFVFFKRILLGSTSPSGLINPTTISICLFLFATIPGLATCIGYNEYFRCFFSILAGILLYLYILDQIQDTKQLESLIFSCIVSGFIWALAGLMIFKTGNTTLSDIDILQIYRLKSLANDPNFFAIILIGFIQLSLFWVIKKNNDDKFFGFVALVTMVIALIFTYSRGGYLAFAGIVFLNLFFFLIFRKQYFVLIDFKKIKVLSGIFIIALIVFPLVFNTIGQRFVSIKTQEQKGSGRIDIWKDAINVIKKNPLGVGLKNFELYTIKHRHEYKTAGSAVHNTFLQMLAETGIVGFLFYMFFLGTIFLKIRYAKFMKDKNVFYWFTGTFISINGIIICSLFLSNGYKEVFFIMLALCLGAYKLYRKGRIKNTFE
ncbi:MAG: O-antigen ligase family protein [Deltaproteobacteria bacterium]|nr:O-antigen ligase family protein [Deltaproteobacteria bacterium]